jgi:hypothetical protein
VSGAKPGAANPNWCGGRTVDPRGYVLIKMPEHPAADVRGYVYEHRLVMERELGRRLLPGEQVRRRDGDNSNNEPSNLYLRKALDYAEMTSCACGCGTRMTLIDPAGRARKFVSGHNTPKGCREGARPKSEQGAGISVDQREGLSEAFIGLCAYGCGRSATCWDHVIPWSTGGSFAMAGNAVPACRLCNQRKSGSTDVWSWIERGMKSDQSSAWEDLIGLALSWGALDVPYDEEVAA